jgi:DNA-binding SARP family transcriptional activator
MTTTAHQAREGSSAWSVGLLGGFRLLDAGQPLDLSTDAQRLVAFLALSGTRVTRVHASGRLWMDRSQERAFANLRASLYRIRRTAGGLVNADARTVGLSPDIEVDIDLIGRWGDELIGLADGRNGHARNGHTIEDLRPLALELLPGWDDEWTVIERERIRQLCLHRLEEIADRLVDLHCYPLAIQAALTAIRFDPLRESAHRRLIRAHLGEGNSAEALRAYKAFEDLLANELGLPPTQRFGEIARDLGSVHHLVTSFD